MKYIFIEIFGLTLSHERRLIVRQGMGANAIIDRVQTGNRRCKSSIKPSLIFFLLFSLFRFHLFVDSFWFNKCGIEIVFGLDKKLSVTVGQHKV